MRLLYDNCPLCRSNDSEILFEFKNSMRFLFGDFQPIKLRKRVCLRCGHIFCDRYHSFEELENHYRNARDSSDELIYNPNDKLDELFSNLAEWFYDASRMNGSAAAVRNILDLGCGKCDLLMSFKNVFPQAELSGVDFSAQARAYGEMKGIDHVLVGDFIRQNFTGLNVDIISATGILEHQIDLDAFLRKIRSLCHEGTYLLIEVPDSVAIIKERADLQGKYMHDVCNDEHVHHFGFGNLASLLSAYDFTLIAHRTIQRGDWQALDVICRYGNKDVNQPAGDTGPSGREILDTFSQKKGRYLDRFHQIISRYQRLGIYGAGWHTSVLLPAFFEMPLKKIDVIFDKDRRKVGKELFGVNVCYPSKDSMECLDAILISSINMEESIFDYLISCGIPSEKIIRLYEAIAG